ncbi:26S proteasome non-ATPase regulatory subunit 1-like A [Vitis vinifera]|uniref:26S proteasome non-ATPase regulatory subunit 1-like A n=1 Tax=Vitis vinifera TaxID=29760 RepID=A0A438D1Z7_VITVI|nr:26S proteasome non-ATPase regulatory subunit 1-like A [Vitis vinifera]
MATMVSSAGGLLAKMNESHPMLKFHALSNLNTFVDYFWPEISTSVPIMYSSSSLAICLFFFSFESTIPY